MEYFTEDRCTTHPSLTNCKSVEIVCDELFDTSSVSILFQLYFYCWREMLRN